MVPYIHMINNTLNGLINFIPSEYIPHVISENDADNIVEDPDTLLTSVSFCYWKMIFKHANLTHFTPPNG